MPNTGGRRVLQQNVQRGGIPSRHDFEQLRRLVVNMSGHNGIQIVHGTRGIQFFGPPNANACEPFQVKNTTVNAAGTTEDGWVTVCVGSWTRNGQKLTLQSDFDRNGGTQSTDHMTIGSDTATAFSASTTNYVWAELQATVSSPQKDPALVPDTVEIVTDTNLPDDTLNAGDTFDTRNIKVLLATVTVDSDGKVSNIERHWYGGDIDDICILPDGEWDQVTPVTDLTNDPRYTLELNRESTSGHEGELQLWGVDDAGYTSSNVKGATPFNAPVNYGMVIYDPKIIDVNRNDLQYIPFDSDLDGLEQNTQRSLQINAASDTYAQAYKFDVGPDGTAIATSVAGTDGIYVRFDSGGGNYHTEYMSFDELSEYIEDEIASGEILIEEGTYYHTDLDYTDSSDMWAALGTGKSGGNTDHDDSYWHAYDDGSMIAGHATFVDSKDYHTTGEVRADDFIIQDDVAQTWNAEGFDVDVTDDISIKAANDLLLEATALNLDLTAGTSTTITTGTTFDVDAAGKVTIDSASNTGVQDIYINSSGAAGVIQIEASAAGQAFFTDGGNFIMGYVQGDAVVNTDAGDYDLDIGGVHDVDGNTTVDDVAGSGLAHGHVVSVASLQSGPITEQVLNLQAGGFI